MILSIQQFMSLLQGATAPITLEMAFIQLLADLGYEKFALTVYDNQWNTTKTDLVTQPLLEWHQHFHQEGYDHTDEIGQTVKQQTVLQLWDLNQQRESNPLMQKMIVEALEYGLNSGASLPLFNSAGQQAILVLHSKNVANDFQEQPQNLLSIYAVAQMYFEYQIRSYHNEITLSAREREVLQLAVTLSTQQIAEKIHRTPRTVTFHLENIKIKLSAKSKAEAIYNALKLALIH